MIRKVDKGDIVRLLMPLYVPALFLLYIILIPVTVQGASGTDNKLNLVVASSDNFPPMTMLDGDGNLTGFSRDLSTAVAGAVGAEVQYLHSPIWSEVLQWLAEGKADLIPVSGYTEDRVSSMEFTDPILEMPEVIFVRNDTYDINSLESLRGKRVACIDNHSSHIYLSGFPNIQCVQVHTPLEGLYHLVSGDADAFVYPQQVVLYQAQELRVGDKIKIVGEPLRTLKLYMAVKKDNKELLGLLNEGIQTVSESGEYDRIYQKWFGARVLSGYSRNEVIAITAVSTGIAILVVLAAALWFINSRLRKGKEELEAAYEENIRTSEKLRQSEENFRLIFDNASEGIIIVDIEAQKFVMANRTFCNMLGFSPEEMLDLWITDIHPKASMPFVVQQFENVVHGRQNLVSDIPVQRKDGSVFPTDILASRFILNSRPHLIGLFRDISDRKEAELQFRTIVETAHDAFWLVDTEGRILDANEAACRMLGYPRDEFLGIHINSIDAEETPEETEERIRKIFEAGSGRFEVRQRRKDGTIIDVEVSTNLTRNQKGEAVFYSFLRDITERKRAEGEIRESRQMLKQVMDSIPVRVFWKDRNSVYLGCNYLFARDAGLASPEEIIGKNDFDMSWRGTAELYRSDDAFVIQNETEKLDYEEPQSESTGKSHWVRTSKVPLRDTEGRVIGVLGTYEDITERKRLDEDLRLKAQVIEQIHDAVVSTDLQGYITGWNSGAERLYEYSADEVVGKHIEILYPEDELEFLREKVIAPLKESGAHEVNVRVKRKSGEIFFAHLSMALFMGSKGETAGMVGYSMDITDRVSAEEKLKERDRDLQTLINAPGDAILLLNADGTVNYVNEEIARRHGASVEELRGNNIYDYLPPELAKSRKAVGDRVIASGEPAVFEDEHDGFTHENRVYPVFNEEGKAVKLAVISRDITDRKQTEEDMRVKNAAIESSVYGIAFADASASMMYVNRSFLRMWGYESSEEVIGRSVIDFWSSRDETMQVVNAIQETGSWEGELVGKKKDNTLFAVQISAAQVTDGRGTPLTMMASFQDISDRKKAEDELRRRQAEIEDLNRTLEQRVREVSDKNRQKDMLIMQQSRLASMGEMIGHIAHQWRQPLNALNLIIFNIKHFHDEGELSDETLSSLTSKGNLLIQKMSHTIDDFRNFFRPDRARQEFSINDTVRDSLALLEASFKHNDISVEIQENGDVRLMGFSNEYSQVLLNVLNNARGAIIEHEADGHIQLEIKTEGNEGILLVRDDGGGIPEKLLGKIFDPYFTTRDEGQGTGLGLYMSKIIIEEHMKGKLSARNLNSGAEIRIAVPLAGPEVNRGLQVSEVEHDRN